MQDYVYRFRSIERLIGENSELERQEIYFASPNQLNDPMEGFKDIFWHGDFIAWKNLFKHFLLCLNHAYGLLAVMQEEHKIEWKLIPIFDTKIIPLSTQGLEAQSKIIERFFSESQIGLYLEKLAARKIPLRRDELRVHLKNIHLIALLKIYDVYRERGMVPDNGSGSGSDFLMKAQPGFAKMIDTIPAIDSAVIESKNQRGVAEAIYLAQRNMFSQLGLLNQYSGKIDGSQKNKVFVMYDFPDSYVDQLEKLVHPDWYAACFMSQCTNSSTWGHYGKSHKGVCLKYKVKAIDGKMALPLRTLVGENGAGRIYNPVNHQLQPIKYKSDYPEIDFFRSLGRLPIPTLNSQWYRDESGNMSTCASKDMDQQEWRDAYWKAFYDIATTKLQDWAYEDELRIVLYSSLFDLSPEDRALKYDFNDLDGIIFGIKTSIDDKLKIMKIVDKKCRENNRSDFRFYQAYYNPVNSKIEHFEMSLLKLSQ